MSAYDLQRRIEACNHLCMESPSGSRVQLAADLMLRNPKTLPVDAPVSEVRALLENPSVQMVLLADGQTFAGAIMDLPADAPPGQRAVDFADRTRHDRPRRTCLHCLCSNRRQPAPAGSSSWGTTRGFSGCLTPRRVPHALLRSDRRRDGRRLGGRFLGMGLSRVPAHPARPAAVATCARGSPGPTRRCRRDPGRRRTCPSRTPGRRRPRRLARAARRVRRGCPRRRAGGP